MTELLLQIQKIAQSLLDGHNTTQPAKHQITINDAVQKQLITLACQIEQFKRLDNDMSAMSTKSLSVLGVWFAIIGFSFNRLLEFPYAKTDFRLRILYIVCIGIISTCVWLLIRHGVTSVKSSDPPGLVTVSKQVRDKYSLEEYNELLIHDYSTAYEFNVRRNNGLTLSSNSAIVVGSIALLVLLFIGLNGKP